MIHEDILKLQRRWLLAMERYAARRTQGARERAYSLRSPRKHTRLNGTTFILSDAHRLIWTGLVIHAAGLSQSSSTTWISRETLSQEMGVGSSMMSRIFEDLIDMGFISRKSRGQNRTSITTIYLNPVPQGETPLKTVPVSVEEEDMGYFGARKTPKSALDSELEDLDPEVKEAANAIVGLLGQQSPITAASRPRSCAKPCSES